MKHNGARYYRFLHAIIILAVAILTYGNVNAVTIKKMNYGYNDVSVTNPERGLLHNPGSCQNADFNVTTLENLRSAANDNQSLIMCIFYLYDGSGQMGLWDYRTTAIPEDAKVYGPVKVFNEKAAAVRQAGLKMILRFAYQKNDNEGEYDVPLLKAQQDIAALRAVIQQNSDVIAVLESGFVGQYGEGWKTTHYGNQNEENWDARRTIFNDVQAILPNHKVQVRRPDMKKAFFPAPAITTATDFNTNKPIGRTGFHNDCFLRDGDDLEGYYGNDDEEAVAKQYVADEGRYVPVGGETCFPPFETWGSLQAGEKPLPGWYCAGQNGAEGEMEKLHYSYLNGNPDHGLGNWRMDEASCFVRIKNRLGYRYRIISASAPDVALRGKLMPFNISLMNEGYARPINSHNVYLVFANPTTGAEVWRVHFGSTKNWAPGAVINLQAYTYPETPPLLFPNIQIPDKTLLPAGDYHLHIRIEDRAPRLKADKRYTVQMMSFARTTTGTKNVWNDTWGTNNTWLTVRVN